MHQLWQRPKSVVLASVLALGLGGLGVASVTRAIESNPAPTMKFADPHEPATHAGFAPVVKKVMPAVVSITSSKMVKTPTSFEGGGMDQLFQQFFGGGDDGQIPNGGQQYGRRGRGNGNGQMIPREREQREQGLGSGVIISPDGYIMTNNHVIDGATDIKVTLSDQREFKAKLIGTDPKTDIAVLRIDANDLPSIVIGDSSKVSVGDYALAVGNPFGVGETVTMGIVSAMGRTNLGIEDYEDFIQTDAPINPGNSGGALVNDKGELIGINTAILSHGSEGNQGIGFAVPVNLARTVMDELLKDGKVVRAYLGIVPQDVTPAMARSFGAKVEHGALVGDVTADSPAEKAGLKRGDIIVNVNNKPVMGANDLRMTISMMRPGDSAKLEVLRDGQDHQMTANLAELPGANEHASVNNVKSDGQLSGMSVHTLNPALAQQYGVPAGTNGVVVTDVDPSSAAADAGIRPGDVIQEVNRHSVKNSSDFETAIHGSKDEALLLVNRKGVTMYVNV